MGCQITADCVEPSAPYCDPSMGKCRACRVHADCSPSLACRTDESLPDLVPVGGCYPAEQVARVDAALCSQGGGTGAVGQPFCDTQAAVDSGRKIVVVRPQAGGRAYGAITLSKGTVTILGSSRDTNPAVLGGVALSGADTAVMLADLAIQQGDAGRAAVACDSGQVNLLRVGVTGGRDALVVGEGCALNLDRSAVQGAARLALQVKTGGRYRVTNALFAGNGSSPGDIVVELGSSLSGNVFTFNTLANNQGLVYCRAGQGLRNTIIGLPAAGTMAFFNDACLQERVYVGAQATLRLDARYALTDASDCCVGKALPDPTVPLDYDGKQRPALPDLGCFQLH